MKRGYLSSLFNNVAHKRLSAVEADRHRSNQHEFDGVASLKRIFGSSKQTFRTIFVYMDDNDEDTISDSGFLTWYDSREAHPTRSEYRLYFPDTAVSDKAEEGDLLVICERPNGELLVIIAKEGSTAENQIKWLFAIHEESSRGYSVQNIAEAEKEKLTFAAKSVLQSIGVEVVEDSDSDLDDMLRRFNGQFPKGYIFSKYARETLPSLDYQDDPDSAILQWMDKELMLFQTLEKHLVRDTLNQGFKEDVDTFLKFSLSVHNRRKSRAGRALENHLEFLFQENRIKYTRDGQTEGKSKPDFIFPGIQEYRDSLFPDSMLTMLGVKTSCKDRWRQVIAEAARINPKHLFTLEPGISEHQTEEMESQGLCLVIPHGIHETYSQQQKNKLLNLVDFLTLIKSHQLKI